MNKIQKLPQEAYNQDSITDTFFSGKTRKAVAALALTLTALSANAQSQIVDYAELTANDTFANVAIVCLDDKPFDVNKFIINDTGKIGLQFESNSMEPIVGWGVEQNPNLQASLDKLCSGEIKQANEELRIKVSDNVSATVNISINEVTRTYDYNEALEVGDVNMVPSVSEEYQVQNPELSENQLWNKMVDVLNDFGDKYEQRMETMPEGTEFEQIFSQYISDIEGFNPKVLNGIDLENDSQEVVIEKMNANFEINEDKSIMQDYDYMESQKTAGEPINPQEIVVTEPNWEEIDQRIEMAKQKDVEITSPEVTEIEMPNFGKTETTSKVNSPKNKGLKI